MPLPEDLADLFDTCTKPQGCATSSPGGAMQRKGAFMSTPPMPRGGTPPLDFNNDGMLDMVADTTICTPSGERPLLVGPHADQYLPFLSYTNECRIEAVPSGTKLWEVSKVHYTVWREAFGDSYMRFYNTDRTMSFAPGEQVVLRSGGMPRRLESIVVWYEPEGGQEGPKVFAILSGCKVVGLDELAWVTAMGERLDMARAQLLAGISALAPFPTSDAPTKAEEGMGNLLKTADQELRTAKKAKQEEVTCDRLLTPVKTAQMAKQLPEGWEKSSCFALGISPY